MHNIVKTCVTLGSIFIFGCGNTTTHRQTVRDQNEANQHAQEQDLKPANAFYEGTMKMKASGQKFAVNIEVKTIFETARPGNSEDNTQTMTLPKLSGFMKFPILEQIDITDYSNFAEIINPMGGFSTILFDYGDYDPKTHILILPYNVGGYSQGNFGELQGTLVDGVFVGSWFAKPLGDVATFNLHQTSEL